MKLATTTGDFSAYTANQLEAMEYIAKAGFKYIDYSFGIDYKNQSGIFGDDIYGYIEKVKAHTDRLGVKLVQAHSPMGKPLSDEDGSFTEATRKCIEACGLWEIENIVIHTGYREGLSPEETFRENRAFFMPLLHEAEKYNVNILAENFNKRCYESLYWIDNATDLLKMIEEVSHPLFHAVWDAGHANMQEMPQDEELRILGSHVRALHIQDNMGEKDTHHFPFCGSLSLDCLMHGLMDIGYSGYFTFEASNLFSSGKTRRSFEKDERLLNLPLSLKLKAEELLYEIGKTVLTAYGLYEE